MKALRKTILRLYKAMLALLPRLWVAEMFRLAGAQLGVSACVCEGKLGGFEARLSDRGVLGQYLLNHTWEPGIQGLLATLTKPGNGTFVDIGANVGLTMIPLGRAYPQLRLIGFEADRENYGYLRRNVDRNGLLASSALHECAVFSSEGELEFERSVENAGDHRIRQSGAGVPRYGELQRQVVRVKCARFDSVVDADALLQPIGMKCDIQGAEVHFFKGAASVLSRTDWLIVEYWPYGILRAGTVPDDFFKLLVPHFSFGGIVDTENASPPQLMPMTDLVAAVAARLRREDDTAHCELLFTKRQTISSSPRV